MKRLVATILFTSLMSGSALASHYRSSAQPVKDIGVENLPCPIFARSVGSQLYDDFLDQINPMLDEERFGSGCNHGQYVEAVCNANPNMSVGEAIDRLKKMRKLPAIPRCGA